MRRYFNTKGKKERETREKNKLTNQRKESKIRKQYTHCNSLKRANQGETKDKQIERPNTKEENRRAVL